MKKRLIKKLLKYTFKDIDSYNQCIKLAYHRNNLKEVINFRKWDFKTFREYSHFYRLRKKSYKKYKLFLTKCKIW
jgi:hypothetical protein